MAKVYITEHPKPTVYYGHVLPVVFMPPLATQTVGISTAVIVSSTFGATTYLIGVHTDAICSIAVGATVTVNDRRMAANTTEYFEVLPGSRLAVISNT